MPLAFNHSSDETGLAVLEQFYSSAGMQAPSGEAKGMDSSNQFSKASVEVKIEDRGLQTLNPMGY